MSRDQLIAVVDDDETLAEATRELVETFGLSAHAFLSAAMLLNSESLSYISCVIADVQMPNMNGLELHRELVRLGYRIPVIFITAFADPDVRKRALRAGAICYLRKPFNPRRLIDCLHSAIGRWEQDCT